MKMLDKFIKARYNTITRSRENKNLKEKRKMKRTDAVQYDERMSLICFQESQ